MTTSIYISNEKLQAVCGEASAKRISVKSCAQIKLTEGTMINGIIMDEQGLGYALNRLRSEYPGIPIKNVRLVIASSQIFVKTALVPSMNKAKTLEWIKGEFRDIEGGDELIFDYAVLESRKGQQGVNILMCAAKKELIGSYLEIFGSNDISVSCIDIVQNSRIKLLRLYPSLAGRSYILLDFDGNTLDSALYSDGIFKFSNRSRLLNEPSGAGFLAEVEQIISNTIQFNKSDRSSSPVDALYVAGLYKDAYPIMAEIGASFGIAVSALPDNSGTISSRDASFRVCDYACALGNLID